VRSKHVLLLLVPPLLTLSALSGCAASSTQPTTTATPATPAPFTITWNSLTFPATNVGATSSTPLVATLWNSGSIGVAVAGVTNSNTAEFPWSTTCPLAGSLAAGSTCTITTQFKPAAAGVQTATLVIHANANDQTLSLTGTGTQAVDPQLTIVPSAGSASTPFTLTLTAATPGGQVALHTIYAPAPGNPDIPFATTLWTADASGSLSATSTHDSPGTFENWFVDVATGLSSNHVISSVQ
jgi:hypothetical protein